MTVAEPQSSEEQAIVARLGDAGYEVGSLAELRNSGVRYVKAVPILVDALSAVTDKKTLMEVIRALSVPWARPIATAPLIDAFRRVDDPSGLGLRWAAGNALDITWDDVCFDELASLARDRSFGRAREMVVLGLARSKRPEVGDILVGLLNDPDVSGHATKALSKRAVPQAREGLVRMTADSRAWVRKAAADALRKLDQGL